MLWQSEGACDPWKFEIPFQIANESLPASVQHSLRDPVRMRCRQPMRSAMLAADACMQSTVQLGTTVKVLYITMRAPGLPIRGPIGSVPRQWLSVKKDSHCKWHCQWPYGSCAAGSRQNLCDSISHFTRLHTGTGRYRYI